jgi:glycine hydroxymethyltransferase
MAMRSTKGDKSEHLIWKMFNFLFNWAPRFRTDRHVVTKEGTLPMAVNTVHLQDQADLLRRGMAELHAEDLELAMLLDAEVARQHRTLSLVASSCAVKPRTLVASASALVNITAEGAPGRRHRAGCENVDLVESLAIRRARELFDAHYAGVQSHSASNANAQVLSALLEPGDTLLGMAHDHGGHLTHGSPAVFTGAYYKAIRYGTTAEGLIDYEQVRSLALAHRPRIIICGASAYSRVVDFERFRAIADEAGAILLADISHIAGLVVTGRHPSPINAAHVTTTCTHKQLGGPRGGLILSGRDAHTKVPGLRATFSRVLDQAVFPRMQGAPAVNMIAAKAAALGYAMTPAFDACMGRIRTLADEVASAFQTHDYEVVGGRSENHTVLIRLRGGMTGAIAESALESCGIVVNKNRIPGETRSSAVASGLCIGTGSMAQRDVDTDGCRHIVDLVCRVLDSVTPLGEHEYRLEPLLQQQLRLELEALCAKYPIADYGGH